MDPRLARFSLLALCALASPVAARTVAVSPTYERLADVASTPVVIGAFGGTDERVARVQEYMAELGIDSLTGLGTIKLEETSGAAAQLEPGIHLVDPDGAVMVPMMRRAGAAPMRVLVPASVATSSLSATETSLRGYATATPIALGSTVYRFEGEEVTDVAVVLAEKVVFTDALLTLSESVREFIIVAETVESDDASSITWARAGTAAESHRDLGQADDGTDYNHSSGGNSFDATDGGDGDDGGDGAVGNEGQSGPSVFVYVKTLACGDGLRALPAIDVSGQAGGVGQGGEDGGDGGDGEKGLHAEGACLGLCCTRGPGYGGDGGDGGEGGDGGDGGEGGAGGVIELNYVEFECGDLTLSSLTTAGGDGGGDGDGGEGGDGGRGGEEGDLELGCRSADREGDDGRDGGDGPDGSDGADGDAGSATLVAMDLSDWEAAFTAPYLVVASPTSVRIGETITFTTANITGAATLVFTDHTGAASSVSLTEAGTDTYTWTVADDFDAQWVEGYIRRSSDSAESNVYAVEVLPSIDGVVHLDRGGVEDALEARPGGLARLQGLGFRDDALVIWEDEVIDDVTWCTSLCSGGLDYAEFRIPLDDADGDQFIGADASESSVFLDLPDALDDSDVSTVALLKHRGITFVPSVNGFTFDNGDITDHIKANLPGNWWTAFRDTYGEVEIDVLLASRTFAPLVGAFYAGWAAWWSNPDSAVCMGMSVQALGDFLIDGTSDHLITTEADVWWPIMLYQGKLLSREVLRALVFDTLLDGVSEGAANAITVDQVTDFLEGGEAPTDAPVIIMIPELEDYEATVLALLELMRDIEGLLGSMTLVEAALWIVEIVGDSADLGAAVGALASKIGEGHALAPYLIVWADEADARPARIYFYDVNYPGDDDLYISVTEVDGDVEFEYVHTGDSTATGWVMGGVRLGTVRDDVNIPLSPLP